MDCKLTCSKLRAAKCFTLADRLEDAEKRKLDITGILAFINSLITMAPQLVTLIEQILNIFTPPTPTPTPAPTPVPTPTPTNDPPFG